MKKMMKPLMLSSALVLTAVVSLPANAFWWPFNNGWGGPWGGGPWGSHYYGNPYYGYGTPYYGGYPYYGYPGYGYPGYGYGAPYYGGPPLYFEGPLQSSPSDPSLNSGKKK